MSFRSNTLNNGFGSVRSGGAGKTGNSTGYDNTARCNAASDATSDATCTTDATDTTTRGTSGSDQNILQCQDLYQRSIWF